MTTIVYRDGLLAADTALSNHGAVVGRVTKIWRREDGALGGCVGNFDNATAFRDHFLGGGHHPYPALDDEAEGIVIMPDGRVRTYLKRGTPSEFDAPFYAIGSGFQIALGALYAGADAARAVEIAATLDLWTRLPLTILRLGEPA